MGTTPTQDGLRAYHETYEFIAFGDMMTTKPGFGVIMSQNFGTPMPSLGMIFRAESGGDGLVAQNLATSTEIEH